MVLLLSRSDRYLIPVSVVDRSACQFYEQHRSE